MIKMEGNFELFLIKKDSKYICTIIFLDNPTKIEKKEFINHKKLLKYFKILIKSSVKYSKVIQLLEEFKLKVEG